MKSLPSPPLSVSLPPSPNRSSSPPLPLSVSPYEHPSIVSSPEPPSPPSPHVKCRPAVFPAATLRIKKISMSFPAPPIARSWGAPCTEGLRTMKWSTSAPGPPRRTSLRPPLLSRSRPGPPTIRFGPGNTSGIPVPELPVPATKSSPRRVKKDSSSMLASVTSTPESELESRLMPAVPNRNESAFSEPATLTSSVPGPRSTLIWISLRRPWVENGPRMRSIVADCGPPKPKILIRLVFDTVADPPVVGDGQRFRFTRMARPPRMARPLRTILASPACTRTSTVRFLAL